MLVVHGVRRTHQGFSASRKCKDAKVLPNRFQAPKLSQKGSAWPLDLMLFFLERQKGPREKGAEEEPALLQGGRSLEAVMDLWEGSRSTLLLEAGSASAGVLGLVWWELNFVAAACVGSCSALCQTPG